MDDTLPMNVPTQVMPSLSKGKDTEQQESGLRVVLVHDRETVQVLLDWLERSGRAPRELVLIGDDYLVRWPE
jgi:hypothetical protein